MSSTLGCMKGEPISLRMFLRCIRRLVLGETDGGGFEGSLRETAGVKGGGISIASDLNGEDDTKEGVGCFIKDRTLLGLISWDDDLMRAISSSARPRFIFGRLPSNRGSFGSG